jgi:hypothetical protein
MPLEKAYITNLETNEEIQCLFNPTEYTFTKSNTWEDVTVMGGDVPVPRFTGGQAMTLNMTLFFDTFEAQTDVRDHTEKLLALMQVDPDLRNDRSNMGRPPRVMFSWGRVWGFKAIITEMSQNFTYFLEDGRPVRATVEVTFQQVEHEGTYPPQNPTTAGRPGRRTYVVRPGDRLDWISYEHYRDPTCWRLIAEANDLDDPLQLVPGQRLVIVPRRT